MTTDPSHKQYLCPGESYTISRSVHLARLASFYPPCRECPCRSETGQLPARTVKRLQQTERRIERPTLFTTEGVRGVYLNEISRAKAASMTAAFAAMLVEHVPLLGRVATGTPREPRQPPVVMVGSDQRPASPDIATGVGSALRRMGCSVVDIGPTTKPCLLFNVHGQQAAGGVMITGSGCDPSWTGLDFVASSGRPISMVRDREPTDDDGLTLNRLERLASQTTTRATRSAGAYRQYRGFEPYEAGLLEHFHALRPLRVVVGCPSRLVQRTLARLFDALPCRLIPIEIPQRARNVGATDDADILRIGNRVIAENAHLGVLIDDDGMRCGFVDERGQLVAPLDITRLFARHTGGGASIVVEQDDADLLRDAVDALGGNLVASELSLSAIYTEMQRHQAEFAGGRSGRFWFRAPLPVCDAIVTVANLLKALSETDAPFSVVVESMFPARSNAAAA